MDTIKDTLVTEASELQLIKRAHRKADRLAKVQEARQLIVSDDDDKEQRAYIARSMTQASLPHRKIAGNEYTRSNGDYSLHIMAPEKIGLPYGSLPRLLLIWVSSEAAKTRFRELDLGDSLSAFMRSLGLPVQGGPRGYIRPLKDQMLRLFSSSVSCIRMNDRGASMMAFHIAERAEIWWHPDPRLASQSALWPSTVTLSKVFFDEVVAHPVPLDLQTIRALKQSLMRLDIYQWLVHRLFKMKRETEIPWEKLQMQFGANYGRLRDFKAAFCRELREVLWYYPGARVSEGDRGLLLRPSPPHVRPRGAKFEQLAPPE